MFHGYATGTRLRGLLQRLRGTCCGDRILRKYPRGYVADYVPGVRCRDMPKFFVAKEQVSMCAVTFNWFNINTRTKLNLFLQHTQ